MDLQPTNRLNDDRFAIDYISFRHQARTRRQLRKAKRKKQGIILVVMVTVWRKKLPDSFSSHTIMVAPGDKEAALDFVKNEVEKSGLAVDTITVISRSTGIIYAPGKTEPLYMVALPWIGVGTEGFYRTYVDFELELAAASPV